MTEVTRQNGRIERLSQHLEKNAIEALEGSTMSNGETTKIDEISDTCFINIFKPRYKDAIAQADKVHEWLDLGSKGARLHRPQYRRERKGADRNDEAVVLFARVDPPRRRRRAHRRSYCAEARGSTCSSAPRRRGRDVHPHRTRGKMSVILSCVKKLVMPTVKQVDLTVCSSTGGIRQW